MKRKFRVLCSMLMAWILMLSVMLAGFPASVIAQEEFLVYGIEVMEQESSVRIEFSQEVFELHNEEINAEGRKDGDWHDIAISSIDTDSDSHFVIVSFAENMADYSDITITFHPEALIGGGGGHNSTPISVNVDHVKDFRALLSSQEAGDVAEAVISFEVTREFYMESYMIIEIPNVAELESAATSIKVDGMPYEGYINSDASTIEIFATENIVPGQKVEIVIASMTLPEMAGDLEIHFMSSENDARSVVYFPIVSNFTKHPRHVSLTPVTADGEETVAYTHELTTYKLTFTTEQEIEEWYTLQLWVPSLFGFLGESEFPEALEFGEEEAAELVDITVTDQVYQTTTNPSPTGIYAFEQDGQNMIEISTDEGIPAQSEVTVMLNDLLVNPPERGWYFIELLELGSHEPGWIQIPVLIEQGKSTGQDPEPQDPEAPPMIEDLELQVSNHNGYFSTYEFGEIYFFGNGQDVTYTFTGTATSESDEIEVILDEQFLFRTTDEPFEIKDAVLQLNGQQVPIEASLDGIIVYIFATDSSGLDIQVGDVFELQLIMDNPELFGTVTIYPSFHLWIGDASGDVTTEIYPFTPTLAMVEPYAGISQAKYILSAFGDIDLSPSFSTVSVEFPLEVDLPAEISPEHIMVYAEAFQQGNEEPQLEQVEVVGQSIKLIFDQPLISLSAIFQPEAGIPTPKLPGSYKYQVYIDQLQRTAEALFTAAPQQPDPRALSAEIIGLLNVEVEGIGFEIFFDREVQIAYMDTLFNEMFDQNPIRIEFKHEGVDYDLPLCFYSLDGTSLWIMAGCELNSEFTLEELYERLQSSTEAYITIDNEWIRHPEGSFSEGKQRVKIITEAAIESKLMEYVPQGEKLDIGTLVQAMNDDAMTSLFGGELEIDDVRRLLEYIETKYIESVLPAA